MCEHQIVRSPEGFLVCELCGEEVCSESWKNEYGRFTYHSKSQNTFTHMTVKNKYDLGDVYQANLLQDFDCKGRYISTSKYKEIYLLNRGFRMTLFKEFKADYLIQSLALELNIPRSIEVHALNLCKATIGQLPFYSKFIAVTSLYIACRQYRYIFFLEKVAQRFGQCHCIDNVKEIFRIASFMAELLHIKIPPARHIDYFEYQMSLLESKLPAFRVQNGHWDDPQEYWMKLRQTCMFLIPKFGMSGHNPFNLMLAIIYAADLIIAKRLERPKVIPFAELGRLFCKSAGRMSKKRSLEGEGPRFVYIAVVRSHIQKYCVPKMEMVV